MDEKHRDGMDEMNRYEIALGKEPDMNARRVGIERRRLSIIGENSSGKTKTLIDKAKEFLDDYPFAKIAFTCPQNTRSLDELQSRVYVEKFTRDKAIVDSLSYLRARSLDALFVDDVDRDMVLTEYIHNHFGYIPVIVTAGSYCVDKTWPTHFLPYRVGLNRNGRSYAYIDPSTYLSNIPTQISFTYNDFTYNDEGQKLRAYGETLRNPIRGPDPI